MPTVVEEFVYKVLSYAPASATGAGYHVHGGQRLDEKLDSFDAAHLREQREYLAGMRQRLAAINVETLSADDKADHEIIAHQVNLQLAEFDVIQSYKHNPTLYVELLGNALFAPFVLDYAPLEERYRHITARLAQVPRLLAEAKQNLVDAPELWTKVALEENSGNRNLIAKVLVPKSPKRVEDLLKQPAKDALAAIDDFDRYLKNDLAKRTSDWRLGKERYAVKFAPALGLGVQPEQVLLDAEAELARVRKQMAEIAAGLKVRGAGAGPDGTVRAALDEIARMHAKPQDYFQSAETDLEEVRRFVREKGFVKLPERDNLKVIETPQFMRGIYAVGGFNPAPALEPKLGAFYWLTPIEPSMSAQQVESKLREYNTYGLKLLTIHEAIPGHYLQFEYANDVQPQSRRILRSLFGNGPYVEGWAVYSTEVVVDEGYLNQDPRLRLTWLKQYLRAVANAILDIRMQTMGMTDEQAMDLMINQTYQEKQEATAKLQRTKLSSAQLPTYFTGFRAWKRLREAEQRRRGAEFRLVDFHHRALATGAVPMPALTRILEAR